MTYDEYDDYTKKALQKIPKSAFCYFKRQTDNAYRGYGGAPFETNHTNMMDELKNAPNKSVPKNLINLL